MLSRSKDGKPQVKLPGDIFRFGGSSEKVETMIYAENDLYLQWHGLIKG